MTTQETSQPSTPVAAVTLPSIALLGKAGSGKDTAAGLLQRAYPYERIAFADALKQVAAQIWGPSAKTNRPYLQQLGVAVREIDPDAWVNIIARQIDAHNQLKNENPFAVTDVRFPNEVRALLARGFITVKVVADRSARVARLTANGKLTDEAQLEHESETALDGFTPDYIALNTGTQEEFAERLFDIVEQERARRG